MAGTKQVKEFIIGKMEMSKGNWSSLNLRGGEIAPSMFKESKKAYECLLPKTVESLVSPEKKKGNKRG